MNIRKNLIAYFFLMVIGSLFFLPEIVGAVGGGLVPCGTGTTACTLCDLIVGFSNVTKYLLGLVTAISIAGLFFSGVMYIVSAGDDGMMKSAKDFAKSCVMGFAIVLGAWLMINVTLWVIGSDISMAVGHGSWFELSCDSSSDL